MKVLVIEDDPLYQLYLVRYLESMGLVAISADLGLTGLQIAVKEKPDFILMDMGLPDINGLDCLDLLKRNPDTSHIPVITMTADASNEFKKEVLYLSAHVYLMKPVTPDDLRFYVQKIRDMLDAPDDL